MHEIRLIKDFSICLFLGFILFQYVDRRRLRLLVHYALFSSTGQRCYFLNLTNLSRFREIEVTNIWLESEPEIEVINPQRSLPKRLKPDEVWETWIEIENIPVSATNNPYKLFKARLSSGKVVSSIQNKNLRPRGKLAGGPIKIEPMQN